MSFVKWTELIFHVNVLTVKTFEKGLKMKKRDKLHEVPQSENTSITHGQLMSLARSECADWLGMLIDEYGNDGKQFEPFAQSIIALTEATNEESVRNAIYLFAKYCQEGADFIKQARTARETLRDYLAKISVVQCEYENRREEKEISLQEIKELIRFDKSTPERTGEVVRLSLKQKELRGYIDSLVASRWNAQAKLEIFERYLRAAETAKKGCPAKLEKDDMPDIPEFVEAKTLETVVIEAPATSETKSGESIPDGKRRLKLREIARQYGFLEVEVFIYSLYDFFGPNNSAFGSISVFADNPQRGSTRVAREAIEMFPDFGWNDTDEFFNESGWRKKDVIDRGFLNPRGSLGKHNMWVRSEKTLPWNPRSLFTETEIADFVETIRKPVPKPEPK